MIPPEIQQKLDEQQRLIEAQQLQIDDLARIIRGFFNEAEMDPEIKRTLTLLLSAASGKVSTSENQAVNEAGSGTYNVLKPPDRFILIGDNNVPAYDA